MNSLQACLLLSSALFAVGLGCALARSNMILVLLGIEIMLNAASLNFIAFGRFLPGGAATGSLFVIFAIAVGAAEAAVGLALVIAIYRHQQNIRLAEANRLKG